ncbi:AAA domain-containing protein [Microbispora bryophytorum]|uniref:AAA domain-containing protein n=1 Tax=Microbispora bryophytorum TaxID=1460882 RepID=UPI003411426D
MSHSIDAARQEIVRAAAAKWADDLVDVGRSNTLLYTNNTGPASLDLTQAVPEAVTRLLAGKRVQLSALFRDHERREAASLRARNLRRKILVFQEEQGIEAGHLVRGLIQVTASSRKTATAPLRAPLLMQTLAVHTRTLTGSDFTLELSEDVVVNPVLIYTLDRLFGVNLETLTEKIEKLLEEVADPFDQVTQTYRLLEEAIIRSGHTSSLEPLLLAGVFSHDKLPMVRELRTCERLMAEHPVIAAIAGDASARHEVLEEAAIDPAQPSDAIRPQDEFLVCDADSSQQRAISRALAGRHVLISGPPGTGKTQTIANIIACMAAHGRSVLFVAEKRAAIEAVIDRLESASLDHLVFDMHDSQINRRRVAEQITDTLDRAYSEPPANFSDLHQDLEKHRAAVLRHDQELHTPQNPWGISLYQAITQVMALAPHTDLRLRLSHSTLRALNESTLQEVEISLRRYVDLDGPRLRDGSSYWSHSPVREQHELNDLVTRLDRLANSAVLTEVHDLLADLADQAELLRPLTIGEWRDLLRLLTGVTRTLATFGPSAFDEDLVDLHYATGDPTWRAANPQRMSWWRRLFLRWQARRLAIVGPRHRYALHEALAGALNQLDQWYHRGIGDSVPREVEGLEHAVHRHEDVLAELNVLTHHAPLGDLDSRTPFDILRITQQLYSDRETLDRVLELNRLTDRFDQLQLMPLLEASAVTGTSENLMEALRGAWLNAVIDEMRRKSSHWRTFTSKEHTRTVEQFRRADEAHQESAARRIRRNVARRIRETSDAYRDQGALVRQQAKRQRGHMALRRLIEKAPDVLLTTFPCWAMSPIVVSRMLPAQKLFDVVIFDEASQILPQDAIPSIMRGKQLIVAGDDQQLPPSNQFKKALAGFTEFEEDDDYDDLGDYESILERMSSLIPHRSMLTWHYRSRDERLIAFSNQHFYKNALTTFPGTAQESPLRLVTVDGTALPGQSGSSSEEVEKVVQLVLEHAEHHHDETLGVISMGRKHAERIEKKLHEALKGRPDLAAFFSDEKDARSRFFIKNLENVQGDERDVTILSIGYAKASTGKLRQHFGDLNKPGGDRRLNVAITRARNRMTVVSSFHPYDLRPQEAKHRAVELLQRFLQYAQQQGTLDYTVGSRPTLNGFERSVLEAMEAANLPVYPQWGTAGYWLDFALAHPDRPGQMVLAVETDGERYHTAASARDRDRLRQEHLERLGWRFHRIWSADWLRDPDGQLREVVRAWEQAVTTANNHSEASQASAAESSRPYRKPVNQSDGRRPRERGPRPPVEAGRKITDYSDMELVSLCYWILQDGLQIPREDRVRAAADELGFKRLGKVIVEHLEDAFDQAQLMYDRQGGE